MTFKTQLFFISFSIWLDHHQCKFKTIYGHEKIYIIEKLALALALELVLPFPKE